MRKIRLQALMSRVLPIDEIVTVPNTEEKTIENKLFEIFEANKENSPLPPVLMDGPIITDVK